ncbi:MAG: hypothetical protein DRH26_00850 [Deltaproteobacteria bacterium]|nr:MAG: hypothetical protein DRH26_00850 [Deltaproteobacteria bacterium]
MSYSFDFFVCNGSGQVLEIRQGHCPNVRSFCTKTIKFFYPGLNWNMIPAVTKVHTAGAVLHRLKNQDVIG